MDINVTKEKSHGFQRPFHPYQVTTWISAMLLILTFGGLSFQLADIFLNLKPTLAQRQSLKLADIWVLTLLLVTYLLCGLATVYFTVLTTLSEPTDPTVAEEREFRHRAQEGKLDVRFDTSNFDFYCAVCNTHVLEDSKHCKKCNRCT